MTKDYQVRESARAKNVLLKIRPSGRLEVVVPRGFDHRLIPQIVLKKKDWIERHAARVRELAAMRGDPRELPEIIRFAAIGREVRVLERRGEPGARMVRSHDGGRLVLRWREKEDVPFLLREFLKAQAKEHLPPMLSEVSRRLGLPYSSTRVKLLKSRWGSCSSKMNINLNAKLMFLEPELVDYVMAHELAHTRIHDHSRYYWTLLEKYLPGARALDKRLNESRHQVPAWADA